MKDKKVYHFKIEDNGKLNVIDISKNKRFKSWLKSDNVVDAHHFGYDKFRRLYFTQCTQHNKAFTISELMWYFKREYIERSGFEIELEEFYDYLCDLYRLDGGVYPIASIDDIRDALISYCNNHFSTYQLDFSIKNEEDILGRIDPNFKEKLKLVTT